MILSLVQEYMPFFRKVCSQLIATLSGFKRPRLFVQGLIRYMVKRYRIELSEFEVPTGGFQTYRDFHARKLKKNAREIDSRASLIFPSDGLVLETGIMRQGVLTQVKGIQYTFDELLNVSGQPIDAREFEGGAFLNLYLPIESYHLWHSPMEGRLVQSKYIHGTFLSLDMQAIYRTKKIFTRNERLVQKIENQGRKVIVVAVGGIAATNIYSVFPVSNDQNICLQRGEQMGGFYLGSSIVLIANKGTPFLPFNFHQKVRLGEPLSL
jgi:phosphatidylserine decarboxylase